MRIVLTPSNVLRHLRPVRTLQKSSIRKLGRPYSPSPPLQFSGFRCSLYTWRNLRTPQTQHSSTIKRSPSKRLYASTSASQNVSQHNPSEAPNKQPCYQLTFTCKPCTHRSSHTISKQGYHHGTVLITCPECKNRHVISDHLKIFADQGFTIEDLMRQKGELVKRGSLRGDGDVEFWDDGTAKESTIEDINL